ncbi:hypothetical protein [Trueperella sp. LYQ143]|uniref:hypothetical protein n=1 Tax=unclassified Trueperella TaxID=2630174 RepID=UPI00398386AB
MTSHPLFLSTLTNRRAIVMALCVASITYGVVFWRTADQVRAIWALAFYIPVVFNAWIDARTHQLVVNWTHLAGGIALSYALVRPNIYALPIALITGIFFGGIVRLSHGRLLGAGDARLMTVLAGWHALLWLWSPLWLLLGSFTAHVVYVLGWSIFRPFAFRRDHAFGPWLVGVSWILTCVA